jgi:hypothetical protein
MKYPTGTWSGSCVCVQQAYPYGCFYRFEGELIPVTCYSECYIDEWPDWTCAGDTHTGKTIIDVQILSGFKARVNITVRGWDFVHSDWMSSGGDMFQGDSAESEDADCTQEFTMDNDWAQGWGDPPTCLHPATTTSTVTGAGHI